MTFASIGVPAAWKSPIQCPTPSFTSTLADLGKGIIMGDSETNDDSAFVRCILPAECLMI